MPFVLESCPYFDRGFCKLSMMRCLKMTHEAKRICKNYMIGFCPLGPDCGQVHLKGLIADTDTTLKILANFPEDENWLDKSALQQSLPNVYKTRIRCHNCGELGHKSTFCQEEPIDPEIIKKLLQEDQG